MLRYMLDTDILIYTIKTNRMWFVGTLKLMMERSAHQVLRRWSCFTARTDRSRSSETWTL